MHGQQNIKIYQIGFAKGAVFCVDRRNKTGLVLAFRICFENSVQIT